MCAGDTETAKNSHCTFNDAEFEHDGDYNATRKPSLSGGLTVPVYEHVRLTSQSSIACSHRWSSDELGSGLNGRCKWFLQKDCMLCHATNA